MERDLNNLSEALARLPSFQPAEQIWKEIDQKLNDLPLQNALEKLPDTQPDDFIWANIESGINQNKRKPVRWWYAAAMVLLTGFAGFLLTNKNQEPDIAYTQEVVDARLQTKKEPVTDEQYKKLVSYCEAETVVCSDKKFKRLKAEYETLQSATEQLQKAMGNYNTEPGLTRQFSIVEQEKAEVLNEMAKMI